MQHDSQVFSQSWLRRTNTLPLLWVIKTGNQPSRNSRSPAWSTGNFLFPSVMGEDLFSSLGSRCWTDSSSWSFHLLIQLRTWWVSRRVIKISMSPLLWHLHTSTWVQTGLWTRSPSLTYLGWTSIWCAVYPDICSAKWDQVFSQSGSESSLFSQRLQKSNDYISLFNWFNCTAVQKIMKWVNTA